MKIQNLIKIFFFLGVFLAGGCVKNEFNLIFELPDKVNTTYKIAYYASDPRGGLEVETAVAVAQGKGELKCITRNPSALWLFSGQQTLPMIVIYAERGDKIRIIGEGPNPYEWEVKGGSKVNDLLTEWRLKNKQLLQDLVTNVGLDDSEKYRKKMNASVAEFVEQHPDSPASVLLLTAYYDSSLSREEYLNLKGILDESGLSEKFADLLSRQDYVSSLDDTSKSGGLKDIIVQSYGKNYDTLKFKSSAAPIFAYFWTPGDFNREAALDSVRKLAKWRSDSAKMTIADISLSPDSSTWAFSVKRDSLRHTLRAISFKGLADKNMMDLEIRKTPWFIVTSGNGKKAYEGQDLDEALRKFRSLKPKAKAADKEKDMDKGKGNDKDKDARKEKQKGK